MVLKNVRRDHKWIRSKMSSDLYVLQRSQITTLYLYLVSGGGISDFPFFPVLWGRGAL